MSDEERKVLIEEKCLLPRWLQAGSEERRYNNAVDINYSLSLPAVSFLPISLFIPSLPHAWHLSHPLSSFCPSLPPSLLPPWLGENRQHIVHTPLVV